MDEPNATNNTNGANGTHITSDKDIVVNCATWLGGNARTGVTPTSPISNGRDIGIDQIVPIENVGDEYVLIKGEGVDNERTIVVSTASNTELFLNGNSTPFATLANAGDYYVITGTEFHPINQNLYLTSSNPVYLYQTTNGGNSVAYDNERQSGLMFLPPVGCSGGKDVFLPDVDAIGTAYINIIANFGANIYVNGVLQGNGDTISGTSDYVTYKLTSGYSGDVRITSDQLIRVALINLSGNIGASGYFSGFTKDFNIQTNTVNGDNIALEGCIPASFTFGIDAPVSTPTVMTYQVWGSATNGVDYSLIDTSVTIPAGQTQATIIINSIQDGIPEGQESIFIVYQPDLCSPLDTAILYIDDAQPIEFTADETNLTCFENSTGEILFNASGGFPPYTYEVSGNTGYSNDTINPVTGLAAGTYTIQVFDIYGCKAEALVVGGVFDADTLFLPDGSGVTYTTQIPISGFGASETIDSLSQIQQICATMEHSYLGDLELKLTSPSGQICILKEQGAGGSCDLGEPFASGPVDGQNSSLTDPGIGYEYCWNSNPTFLTMVDESTNYSHTIPSSTGGTYTDSYLPAGSYQSFDPLSNLLGSSMDGNWTLEVTDFLGLDNGYIFEWNVSLVGGLPDTSITIYQPDSIEMSGFITQAQCGGNDGAINFTANGTQQPFTFLWSNGETTEDISGLTAGNYNVVVTGSTGCSDSMTFNLNNISSLNISSSITAVNCAGGTNGAIDVTTSGGTFPYTYTWSNGETTEDINGLTAGNYTLDITDDSGCQYSESISVGTIAPIEITLNSSDNEYCGQVNGSINVNVSGGSGSYGFSWDNGSSSEDLTNIAGGTYELTVTDANGCQTNQSFSILNDVSNCSAYCFLTVNSTVTDENCGNGTGAIDVTVDQATQPYIVSWNTGATTEDLNNLNAGVYTITVTDANQCVETVNITVGNSTGNLTISSDQLVNENCGNTDGSIDISVAGGTLPYLFSWDNGSSTEDISGLSAGNYVVTITDGNGCTFSNTYTIINNTGNLAASAQITNEICGNGSGAINLSVTGNVGTLSYLWSNGETTQDLSNLSAGLYSCTITDANGCVLTSSSYNLINESSTLVLSNTTITNENCNNGQGDIDITIQGGTSPINYLWSNSETTEDISGLSEGTYSATITDDNGCQVQTGTLNLFNTPGALNVTTDLVTNEICNNGAGAIAISTSGGLAPITYAWSNGSTSEDISSLSAGAYTLTASDGNGCIFNYSESVSNTSGTLQLDNAVITDENCNNGTGAIDLFISGGATPYTFLWSNGETTEDISSLSAGSYDIAITDANGCEVIGNYTVNNNTGTLAVTSLGTAENCSNGAGEIDISVTGGAIPYTFLWSNGATSEDLTGLSGGTYSCTITDNNGCSVLSGNIVLNNNPGNLAVASTSSDESCGNATGTINLTLNGGSSPYNYTWLPNVSSGPSATGLSAGTYVFTIDDANGCTIQDSVEILDNTGTLSLDNFSVIDEICGNTIGAIDLTISGGAAPITYLWSNGATTEDISALSAGTFSCIISDNNGCSINTGTINVANNAGTLAISNILTIDEACGNALGGINITITGGATPYTFLWNTGATSEDLLTGLSAGNYFCNVTDNNGCSIQVQATIQNSQGSLYTISNVVTDESCSAANGEINLNPQGGSTPYTFVWSNGATSEDINGLSAGNYTVTITDAGGCTLIENFTVNNSGANLLISNVVIDDELCGNNLGAINISVQGGTSPFNFNWSDGSTLEDLTNAVAGNYSVTVVDANGCATNGSYTINENTGSLSISSFVISNESCGDGTGAIDVTLSTPSALTYSWSNGATTEDISGLNLGSYTFTATDINGCSVDSTGIVQNITGGFTASITAITDENCGDATGAIDITVSGGTLPYTFVWDNGATTEDLSGLSAGTYFLVITDDNGCSTNLNATMNNISGTLAITSAVTNDENCNDGAGFIDLTVNGTNTPFTYSWDHGPTTQDLSGLSAGLYTVTITDAAGCMLMKNYTINNNGAGLNASIVANDENCGTSDGSITATANGGIAPYTITWTGATPSNCCVFTLDMFDSSTSWNGASVDVTINGANVGNYTVLGGGANTGTFNVCSGDTIELFWNSGAFDNEASFNLLDASGNIIFAQGPSPTPGSIYTGLGSCPALPNNPSTVSNLSAGSYVVTISDDVGCSTSETIVINDIYTFSTNGVVTDESCSTSNGSINLFPSGASSTLTHSWSPNVSTTATASGLAAGNYIVTTTDASGCTKIDSFVVNNVFAFSTSAIITPENCDSINGAIDVTTTGGTAPFTFLWSNGFSSEDITNLASGTYTLTVNDASGCAITDTFVVNGTSTFSTTTLVTNDTCGLNNGAIDVSTTGGIAPFTFAWSNGATTEDISGIGAETYYLTTTDASGCPVLDTIIVTNSTSFTINGSVSNENCGSGDGIINLFPSGGNMPYTFVWSPNVSTTAIATGLSQGSYSVTTTDALGCTDISLFTVIDIPSFSTSSIVTNENCGLGNGAIDVSIVNPTPCCSYTLNMDDSFGDGWDGASIDISINGSLYGNYTIATGLNNVALISICSGDLLELTYNSGIFENEHSYTLLDANSNVLFSASGPPATGMVYSTNANCPSGAPTVSYNWNTGATTEDLSGLSEGNYILIITDQGSGCTKTDTFNITNSATFVAAGIQTDDNCNTGNGAIDLNIAGGSAPYSFLLDNGETTEDISGLNAGLYSVIINDAAGCSATLSFTIGNTNTFNYSGTTTADICGAGVGAIDLNITGGNAPFTFIWSNGETTEDISNLSAATYSVTITDASGCSTVDSFVVNTTSFVATGTTTADICGAGVGAIDLNITGGNAPFTFIWSNGEATEDISNLSAATYSVTITDASGCSALDSFVVNTTSFVANGTITADICGAGVGAIDVNITGGNAPFTFIWSNGETTEDISNLSAATYSVTITDVLGCTVLESFVVNTNSFVANGTPTDASCASCTDGAIDLIVTGNGPFTYAWSNGATTEDVNTLSPGSYYVIITGDAGCQDSLYFDIGFPVGIDATTSKWLVKLFPNPADGAFTLIYNFKTNTKVKFTIFNVIGELVYDEEIRSPEGEIKVNAEKMEAGVYFIKLTSEEHKENLKLIIAR